MPKVALILFPGTNCEIEMLQACKRARLNADIFRWNEDAGKLKQYDAIILPGGFSYEDRGRSGVIAAKDPIMDLVKKEAEKGKPVLGVCNGAQILVESGMIPGLDPDHLDMALAKNERIQKGKLIGLGYYNDWVYIRSDSESKRSPFNRFSKKTVMCIPVAHGEGRFTTNRGDVLKRLIKNEQTIFRYCDDKGKIITDFPVNPNNALYNLAGVCNLSGNVLALMPHPERALSGQPIYDSLADFLQNSKKYTLINRVQPAKTRQNTGITSLSRVPEIMITVKTIITDNEERTLENTIRKNGFPTISLQRKAYFGIYSSNKKTLKNTAETLIKTGEILNLNKEIPTIIINKNIFEYDKKTERLVPLKTKNQTSNTSNFYVTEHDNYQGKMLQLSLKKYFQKNPVTKIERGVYWNIQENTSRSKNIPEIFTELVQTHIFHNPNSMKLVKLPQVL